MNDFDKRFKKHSENFDRDFASMKKWSFIGSIIYIITSLSLIGFGIWVIIMLLQFWGVV